MKGFVYRLAFSVQFLLFGMFLLPKAYTAPLYIDYYGVVSQSSETNILKMAQDIFYTQLNSIENVSVDDKRKDAGTTLQATPDFSTTATPHIAFYAEIAEEIIDTAKEWQCTFIAFQAESQQTYTKTEKYSSYYKILANAKPAIEAVLEKLSATNASETQFAIPAPAATSGIKTEALAGTWTGESDIDKIILLRGGKGFVIFKNGASMNIKVTITNSDSAGNITDLKIVQDAKPNASFFPALPRNVALENAASAAPITWTFHVTDSKTLSGTKTTLVASSESPTGAISGTQEVTWEKK